ncbi:dienelactone hydrolase family protein [Halpernia frigidisoli]|nr:dienelactone hydrolase family protein [Halpernia frigidisoli]
MKISLSIILFAFTLSLSSCFKKSEKVMLEEIGEKAPVPVKTEVVEYQLNGKTYKSFAAFQNTDEKKPVVIVIPEWWGLNDYAKSRAKKLADLGYFALAVDFYGDGQFVETPDEATTLSAPFYTNSKLAKETFDAAKNSLSKFPSADTTQTAVIGYCFGGAQALNMARQEADLKGVVSFHGNLMTCVKPSNNDVPYLVLNGEDDSYVPQKERDAFKKQMDSAQIDYQFVNYPGAVHSFTNPNSTAVGKKYNMKVAYNKEADEKSWTAMKDFFDKIFK